MIDIDTIPLSFGKYINRTPEEIAETDGRTFLPVLYDG